MGAAALLLVVGLLMRAHASALLDALTAAAAPAATDPSAMGAAGSLDGYSDLCVAAAFISGGAGAFFWWAHRRT